MPVIELLPIMDVTACCSPLTQESLDASAAEDLVRALKALSDPARLRLVSMIAAHEGKEACVCDQVEPLGLSQPTVSHHLKVLVDAGFLAREKRGVWAYYSLVPRGAGLRLRVLRHRLIPGRYRASVVRERGGDGCGALRSDPGSRPRERRPSEPDHLPGGFSPARAPLAGCAFLPARSDPRMHSGCHGGRSTLVHRRSLPEIRRSARPPELVATQALPIRLPAVHHLGRS